MGWEGMPPSGCIVAVATVDSVVLTAIVVLDIGVVVVRASIIALNADGTSAVTISVGRLEDELVSLMLATAAIQNCAVVEISGEYQPNCARSNSPFSQTLSYVLYVYYKCNPCRNS